MRVNDQTTSTREARASDFVSQIEQLHSEKIHHMSNPDQDKILSKISSLIYRQETEGLTLSGQEIDIVANTEILLRTKSVGSVTVATLTLLNNLR